MLSLDYLALWFWSLNVYIHCFAIFITPWKRTWSFKWIIWLPAFKRVFLTKRWISERTWWAKKFLNEKESECSLDSMCIKNISYWTWYFERLDKSHIYLHCNSFKDHVNFIIKLSQNGLNLWTYRMQKIKNI